MVYDFLSLILENSFIKSGFRVALIILFAFLINHILQSFIVKSVKSKICSGKKRSETLITVFGRILRFTISILAILLILSEFGVNITALLAGIGVLGLAIGMAARDIIADFLSGIFIIVEDQYNIGDKIIILGIEGEVKEITLRRTVIKSDDNLWHTILNGQIKMVSKKKS